MHCFAKRVFRVLLLPLCLAACAPPEPSEGMSSEAMLGSPIAATETTWEPSYEAPTATPAPAETSTFDMALEWREVACEEMALRDAIAAGGALRLALGCEYQLTSDLPAIDVDIIIDGGGASIDGDSQYRLLHSQSANITIDHLVVRNSYGSGIATSDGSIIVANSVLSGNETQGSGGGISSGAGDVSVFDSELTGNVAVTNGGGISVARGDLTISGSVLEGNSSVGCGAGSFSGAGMVNITGSTFANNRVEVHGGGGLCLASEEAVATITNSTFSGNVSGRGGGAIAAANGAMAKLISSTVYDNQGGRGGGIWTDGTLHLQQSVVAGNHASSANDILVEGTGADGFMSLGYNCIGQGAGLELASTDIVEPVTGLLLLANGVHLLAADSIMRDAVPVEACATVQDQRGVLRPQGAGCDIGAVEMQ